MPSPAVCERDPSSGRRPCGLRLARQAAGAALALGVVLSAAGGVLAQTAKQDSVLERPRPELDPIGLPLDRVLSAVGIIDAATVEDRSSPLASFTVLPRIGTDLTFRSNLFRDEEGAVADRVWVISPALDIVSDWSNHSLRASAGADIGRHRTSTDEDFEDLHLTIAGRLDASDDLAGEASVAFDRLHLQRGEPDDPGPAGGAIVYRSSMTSVSGTYSGAAYRIRLGLDSQLYDFDGSGGLDNDERDRMENEVTLRLAYALSEGSEVFVRPSYNWRVYDHRRDNAGFVQDSEGGEVLLGLAWDLTGVVFAEFGAGYLSQKFDEPRFETVTGPSFNGRLIWNPDELVTLTMGADRRVLETVLSNISGILASRVNVHLDYEILGDVLASLSLEYMNYDYRGSSRADDVFQGEIEAKYLINRNWFTSLKVSHDKRSSNEAGEDYSDTGISFRLGARL